MIQRTKQKDTCITYMLHHTGPCVGGGEGWVYNPSPASHAHAHKNTLYIGKRRDSFFFSLLHWGQGRTKTHLCIFLHRYDMTVAIFCFSVWHIASSSPGYDTNTANCTWHRRHPLLHVRERGRCRGTKTQRFFYASRGVSLHLSPAFFPLCLSCLSFLYSSTYFVYTYCSDEMTGPLFSP
jgi:hypothetical protein